MAAPTVVFRGKATVEGVVGTFDALATNVTAGNQNATLTQNWELEELKDVHGYDMAWLFRNEHATLDLDLFLVATTASAAAMPR